MRNCLIGILLTLISGCVSTIEAQCDYDYAQVFSTYQTFAWIAEDPLIRPEGSQVQVSPLNRERIADAIEAELKSAAMKHVSNIADADFVVSYTVGTRDRLDVQSYPPPYRGAVALGISVLRSKCGHPGLPGRHAFDRYV